MSYVTMCECLSKCSQDCCCTLMNRKSTGSIHDHPCSILEQRPLVVEENLK